MKLYDTYCPGDRIRVLTRSRADIVLFNETTLRLDQNTTVTFSHAEAEKTSLIELLMGAIHFFSRHRRSIRVVTPFVNATVEGTEFYMEVKEDKTFLSIFEGQVIAANQAGEIRLTRGTIGNGRRKTKPLYSRPSPDPAMPFNGPSIIRLSSIIAPPISNPPPQPPGKLRSKNRSNSIGREISKRPLRLFLRSRKRFKIPAFLPTGPLCFFLSAEWMKQGLKLKRPFD